MVGAGEAASRFCAMLLSLIFYLNSLGSFALQIVLGRLLSPTEFGRYATVSLAALTLAAATLDWLKASALRFSSPTAADERVGAALELGYLVLIGALCLSAAAAWLIGLSFGLTPALVGLIPLLAISFNRVDYLGARFRAREQNRAFGILFSLRQGLYFTLVVGVAFCLREATAVVAAMALASLVAAMLVGRAAPTRPAALDQAARERLKTFFAYGQPVVAAWMLYQLVFLVNRSYALHALGAAAAGDLALATDIGSRLFMAINALPEFLLLQFVLKRQREQGTVAAISQIQSNACLVYALIAGLAAGYASMANTFAALVAPPAYRGDFAALSIMLTPGFVALCVITSGVNPIFQLAARTLPTVIASGAAVVVNVALLAFTDLGTSVTGIAIVTSLSLLVGLAAAVALAAAISPARPSMRDLVVTSLAALVMGLGLSRLDALPTHALAAALALSLGGGFYAAVIVSFDIGDIRSRLREGFCRLKRRNVEVGAE